MYSWDSKYKGIFIEDYLAFQYAFLINVFVLRA